MSLEKRRVWYVSEEHELVSARLLHGNRTTKTATLLAGRAGNGGAMIRTIEAPYSEGRQPGTWHFQSKPS